MTDKQLGAFMLCVVCAAVAVALAIAHAALPVAGALGVLAAGWLIISLVVK